MVMRGLRRRAVKRCVSNRRPVKASARCCRIVLSSAIPLTAPKHQPYRSTPTCAAPNITVARSRTMLTNQTFDILRALRLAGMAQAYADQLANPAAQSLPFDDRFGLLADAERAQREHRRVNNLLKRAKLKVSAACVEDIDHALHRGLDKRTMLDLASCQWVERCQH